MDIDKLLIIIDYIKKLIIVYIIKYL